MESSSPLLWSPAGGGGTLRRDLNRSRSEFCKFISPGNSLAYGENRQKRGLDSILRDRESCSCSGSCVTVARNQRRSPAFCAFHASERPTLAHRRARMGTPS